jgi:hypothetical protein
VQHGRVDLGGKGLGLRKERLKAVGAISIMVWWYQAVDAKVVK